MVGVGGNKKCTFRGKMTRGKEKRKKITLKMGKKALKMHLYKLKENSPPKMYWPYQIMYGEGRGVGIVNIGEEAYNITVKTLRQRTLLRF